MRRAAVRLTLWFAIIGCAPGPQQNTGTLTVTVTGLAASAADGGSVSVISSTTAAPHVTVVIPLVGVASAAVPAGTYHLDYAPPAGYTLAPGVPASLDVTVFQSQTSAAQFTVVAPGALVAPNEPPGFTPLTDRPFSAINELSWTDAGAQLSIQTDPAAPRSPPNVGQALFPAGLPGGQLPVDATLTIGAGAPRRLYVSFWVRLSPGWTAPGNQQARIIAAGGSGSPVLEVRATAKGSGTGPYAPVLGIVNAPGGLSELPANLGGPSVQAGAWHHWEMVLVMSTPNQTDGEARWWLDGVKVGEHVNLALAGISQGPAWNLIAWRPLWSGVTPVPAEQTMRIDHLYASGGP